eukprot:UN25140
MQVGVVPDPVYKKTGSDAGNGSLMRLAAIPIFYHKDVKLAREFARNSSYTTHPGPIAAEACAFWTTLCINAINHKGAIKNVKTFIDAEVAAYKKIFWILCLKNQMTIRRVGRN